MGPVTSVWLYYVSVFTVLIASVSSTCNCPDDELDFVDWHCDNGDVILADRLCDGIVHCTDGSDETVKHCLDISCPSYAFRCTYGACIQGSLRCDGHNDCVDGSDETSYLCTSYDYEQIQLRWQGGCRSDTQLQCKNGDCINLEWMCDGRPQCADGTDETFDNCNFLHCPEYAFRCGYGGCVPGTAKCDGIKHCADGSDELETVCAEGCNATCHGPSGQAPQPPSVSPPWKPATSTSTSTTSSSTPPTSLAPVGNTGVSPTHAVDEQDVPGGCVVPLTLPHLLLVELKSKHIIRRGERLPNGTHLEFFCTRGWRREGARKSLCRDGAWSKPLPQCSRNCSHTPITRGISTKATCTLGEETLICKNASLPAGTRATFKCAPGYQPDSTDTANNAYVADVDDDDDDAASAPTQHTQLTCDVDAEWDYRRPKCQPICGRERRRERLAYPHQPWEVSIFRRSIEPTFEFVCYGVIIAPKIVLTAANCLRLTQITDGKNHDKTLQDPIYYNVVEALSTDEYVQSSKSSARDRHNISQIILSDPTESLDAQLAAFVLMRHFRFNRNLAPICFNNTQPLSTAAVLTVAPNVVSQSKTQLRLGNVVSEKIEAHNGSSPRRVITHYLSGVVSLMQEQDNTLQLIRAHYYKRFIANQIEKYNYLL